MPASAAPSSRLDRLADFAHREPGRCLAIVLALHVVVWTALPALLSHNLQLDLAEGLALGREWQLGYWKLPPLPWWLDYGAVALTGTHDALYLLGPDRLGGRDLCGVAARARAGRSDRACIDRRARARRHPLLQFLRREVQSRRSAAPAVDTGCAVPLSRAHRRAHRRLAACRGVPRGGVLDQIHRRGVRAAARAVRRHGRDGAALPAHARALCSRRRSFSC